MVQAHIINTKGWDPFFHVILSYQLVGLSMQSNACMSMSSEQLYWDVEGDDCKCLRVYASLCMSLSVIMELFTS